jgi:2-polyprenyl-3-methyl-5-hydroxy-6-metoxy-1,4-benzoquinol methylase
MESEKRLYNAQYFRMRASDKQRRSMAYAQDAQKIMQRKPDTKSVLDVGAGMGEFENFFDCHYSAYDPFTLHATMPNEKVDVVVFRGTLQHIYNPVVMLEQMKSHLNADGMLAILATPDTDSLGYWRWKTLPALDPERNWIPFGHRMLKNILRRLDYRNIEIIFPYGKPYARPLPNLWNFIIGKPDAFPGNMMEVFAWL